jgi:hypothetical protein
MSAPAGGYQRRAVTYLKNSLASEEAVLPMTLRAPRCTGKPTGNAVRVHHASGPGNVRPGHAARGDRMTRTDSTGAAPRAAYV